MISAWKLEVHVEDLDVYQACGLVPWYVGACDSLILAGFPMRTFPKSLATFRKIIDERGERLRKLSQEELKKLAAEPCEELMVESRPATIGIIVQPQLDGNLRVVVQGFLKARFTLGKHVALDGFYKRSDGTVGTMSNEEFHEFG
jgi:hypothetical protein